MKRWFLRFMLSSYLLGSALCALSVARADPASEANLENVLGKERFKQGRLAEALQHFIRSSELAPNAHTVFNIAYVYREMGKSPRASDDTRRAAYNTFDDYLQLADAKSDVDEREKATKYRDELSPRLAVIEISVNPAGATLFLDRPELGSVGSAPRRLAVDPKNRHRVIARAKGFVEQASEEIEATPGKVQAVHLDLALALTALRISVQPAGAKVRIDDDQWQPAPVERSLPEGKVRVTVEAPGYLRIERYVSVGPTEPVTLNLTLEPDSHARAHLTLRSQPEGAHVSYDGAPLSTTPHTLSNLEPGSHVLRFELANHEPWHTKVALEAGAATRVSAALVAKRTLARRKTLRFTGYASGGVLLLSGASTGIGARVSRNHFYDEPSHRGYDRVGRMNLATDVLIGTGAAFAIATLIWHLASKDPHSVGRISVQR